MAQAQLDTVLRHLRHLAGSPPVPEGADAQLLQRFTARQDEAAFAALLGRHARLVWSVCWQVLGHEQDAEDAFQATFVALARDGASIRQGQAVASWLYHVAQHIARKAARQRAKRQAYERQAPAMPYRATGTELAWRELQAILDDELQRLPEKYRAPFYDLVGKLIGVPRFGLASLLEPIQSYCLLRKLPALTVLVVNAEGRPGTGFIAAADVPGEQQRVFRHGWLEEPTPTPEALRSAVQELPSCGIPEAASGTPS